MVQTGILKIANPTYHMIQGNCRLYVCLSLGSVINVLHRIQVDCADNKCVCVIGFQHTCITNHPGRLCRLYVCMVLDPVIFPYHINSGKGCRYYAILFCHPCISNDANRLCRYYMYDIYISPRGSQPKLYHIIGCHCNISKCVYFNCV